MLRFGDEFSDSSLSEGLKKSGPLTKSFRFGEENEVFHITHLDDMTDEEIASIWYNAEEYSEIKSGYQMTIFMMESGEDVDDDKHTSRGLEYRTQEGAWARYENKRDAYNAVLDEQDRQWKVDQDDFEKIRSIYLEHSSKCAEAAVRRASSDAKAALSYYQEGDIFSLKKKKKKKDATSTSIKKKKDKNDSITDKKKLLEKKKAKLAKLKAEKEKAEQELAASENGDKKKVKIVKVIKKPREKREEGSSPPSLVEEVRTIKRTTSV